MTAQVFTLSIIEGDAGLDAVGSDIAHAPFAYGDLDETATQWLEANGFDTEHPDRWILVTLGRDDPQAVNVIDSREVTVDVHPLAILNTSIVTADGAYTLTSIGLEEARSLTACSPIDSAVGHESTAELLTTLLGVDVATNRQQFAQQPGQHALVCKLNGRPPEGKVLSREDLENIGYTFKILTRNS